MALKIRSVQDFSAGLMFMFLGAGFGLGALKYSMGTASRMGPAYFPSILGWATAILGLIIFLRGFALDSDKPGRTAWKPLFFVLFAVVMFAYLINNGGLMPAAATLIMLAAYGGPNFKLREALSSVVLLCVAVWLIFSVGLGLPFRLWPWSY